MNVWNKDHGKLYVFVPYIQSLPLILIRVKGGWGEGRVLDLVRYCL